MQRSGGVATKLPLNRTLNENSLFVTGCFIRNLWSG